MEFVLLGLLMIRSLTQYDMMSILKRKVSPFYSASLGSIQSALKKLQTNGHITMHEEVINGRSKKIFTITEAGQYHFRQWMLTPVTPSRFEQEGTTKLFFLGLLGREERIHIIQENLATLHKIVQEYEAAAVEANNVPIPQHLQEIAHFQLKTLELGLVHYKSLYSWFQQHYNELEAD